MRDFGLMISCYISHCMFLSLGISSQCEWKQQSTGSYRIYCWVPCCLWHGHTVQPHKKRLVCRAGSSFPFTSFNSNLTHLCVSLDSWYVLAILESQPTQQREILRLQPRGPVAPPALPVTSSAFCFSSRKVDGFRASPTRETGTRAGQLPM